jgi:uncharacterized membrane protein
MQRAMRRKAEKNLDTAGTKQPAKSFTSFSDARIYSNLSSVGVSLGNRSDEISVSANVLRQTELRLFHAGSSYYSSGCGK